MEEKRSSKKNIAIVLAGGCGSRMKSDIPKQYMQIDGKPLLYYPLKVFQESFIDDIVLVCSVSDREYVKRDIIEKFGFNKISITADGGKERYDSVYNGLMAVRGKYGSCDANIFIHDGARPCIDISVLKRALEKSGECRACVAAVPVKDTIKVVGEDNTAAATPDRKTLWQIQTPQVFEYELILKAYNKLVKSGIRDGITDDAMVVERFTDEKVHVFEGSYHNIKVTTPEDILIAETFLNKL